MPKPSNNIEGKTLRSPGLTHEIENTLGHPIVSFRAGQCVYDDVLVLPFLDHVHEGREDRSTGTAVPTNMFESRGKRAEVIEPFLWQGPTTAEAERPEGYGGVNDCQNVALCGHDQRAMT
jgi:hypothetical protein